MVSTMEVVSTTEVVVATNVESRERKEWLAARYDCTISIPHWFESASVHPVSVNKVADKCIP